MAPPSIYLSIASIYLASATEKTSANPYLTSAETNAKDQRLAAQVVKLKRIAANTPDAPKTDAEIINRIKGDWLALEKYLRGFRQRGDYLEWLETNKNELPTGKYWLEKGTRLLHKETLPRQPGDPEYQQARDGHHSFYYEPHRNAEAVPVFQEALKYCTNSEDRVMAYVGLVSALARTDQDYNAVLNQYLAETVDPRRRGQGLVQMAENLSGDNVVSCSLPNQNPEIAEQIYSMVIAQCNDPEWNLEARYLKGRLQRWLQRSDDAIATLRQMTEQPTIKDDVHERFVGGALILLGKVYQDKGQRPEAAGCFRRIIESADSLYYRDRGEALSLLAGLLYQDGRFHNVISLNESISGDTQILGDYMDSFNLFVARSHLSLGNASLSKAMLVQLSKSKDAGIADKASQLLKQSTWGEQ